LQVYTTNKTIWNYNGTVWINSVSNDLPSTQVFVGDNGGEAAAVALSGAVTIDNTGSVAIDGAVTTAKILDGTILAADIAADAVTTIKIADANATN
jgi:hypothetical protein